jgi:hypothetical protein
MNLDAKSLRQANRVLLEAVKPVQPVLRNPIMLHISEEMLTLA